MFIWCHQSAQRLIYLKNTKLYSRKTAFLMKMSQKFNVMDKISRFLKLIEIINSASSKIYFISQ